MLTERFTDHRRRRLLQLLIPSKLALRLRRHKLDTKYRHINQLLTPLRSQLLHNKRMCHHEPAQPRRVLSFCAVQKTVSLTSATRKQCPPRTISSTPYLLRFAGTWASRSAVQLSCNIACSRRGGRDIYCGDEVGGDGMVL